MWTTTKSSRNLEEIQIRKIWSLTTGKLIDECKADLTPVPNTPTSSPISRGPRVQRSRLAWTLHVMCGQRHGVGGCAERFAPPHTRRGTYVTALPEAMWQQCRAGRKAGVKGANGGGPPLGKERDSCRGRAR